MEKNIHISHSGIKGQKWGVRRFQNEDGTLTAEGKERYGAGNNDKSPNSTEKKNSRSEGQRRKNGNGVKKALAVAGVAAASAAAYIAFKKSTKLRDVLRSNAREEAEKWFFRYNKADIDSIRAKGLSKGYKREIDYALKKGNIKDALASDASMHKNMKKAVGLAKEAKSAQSNYHYYDNLAKNATRRDAIKTRFNERVSKSSVRKAKKIENINFLNRRVKSSGGKRFLSMTGGKWLDR